MRRALVVLFVLMAQPLFAATPTLVQSNFGGQDTSGSSSSVATTLTCPFPNSTLANNLLVFAFQYGSSSNIISSVQDSSSTAWTAGPTNSNSTTQDSFFVYYRAGAPAGITSVTVTLTSAESFVQGHCSEWFNVQTSTPSDGSASSGSVTTSPYKDPSFTPTTSGDLILAWGFGFGGGTGTLSSITAGVAGSGFTLLGADIQSGSSSNGVSSGNGAVAEYQVQASAAAIQSDFSTAGNTTATYGVATIAFKSAAAGTAPAAGIRIKFVQHQYLAIAPQTTLQFPTDSSVNLYVGLFNDDNAFITAISDSASTAYSFPAAAKGDNSANGTTAQIIYAANVTGSSTLGSMSYTFNTTPGAGANPLIVWYGVTGAATSPFDNATNGTGNQTSFNVSNPSLSITPTTVNGLVFSNLAVTWNTVQTASVSGQTAIYDSFLDASLDNNTNAGNTSPSSLDEDNGNAHVYNTNTSAESFVWTANTGTMNPGMGQWAAAAAAFKTAPTATARLMPLLGVGP